jgi:GGDEF domain-containing protein
MQKKDWAILYLGVNQLQAFNEVYGFVAGTDVLRFLGAVLTSAVDEKGTPDDFIGHTGGDDFIIITPISKAPGLKEAIQKRFDAEVATFYSFRDRENGYLALKDGSGKEVRAALMTLAAGIITHQDGPFSDIRQITEIAAEVRRGAHQ